MTQLATSLTWTKSGRKTLNANSIIFISFNLGYVVRGYKTLGGKFWSRRWQSVRQWWPSATWSASAEKNDFTLELAGSDEFADKAASYYGTALQAATVAGHDTIVILQELLRGSGIGCPFTVGPFNKRPPFYNLVYFISFVHEMWSSIRRMN